MPQPSENNSRIEMVYDIDAASPDIDVKNVGSLTVVTATKFPFPNQVGLSAASLKLHGNAMLSPMYAADSSVRVIYVAEGSGRIQIVGINGARVLDTKLEAGHLCVVPSFFVSSIIADGEGLECFSLVTTTE